MFYEVRHLILDDKFKIKAYVLVKNIVWIPSSKIKKPRKVCSYIKRILGFTNLTKFNLKSFYFEKCGDYIFTYKNKPLCAFLAITTPDMMSTRLFNGVEEDIFIGNDNETIKAIETYRRFFE